MPFGQTGRSYNRTFSLSAERHRGAAVNSRTFSTVSMVTSGTGLNLLHDLIFISQVKIFSSGRAFQATLRAAP
jgi:hypothetical protein